MSEHEKSEGMSSIEQIKSFGDGALSEQFPNALNVMEEIENVALEKGMSILEAAVEVATTEGLDVEDLAKFITGPLKEKMRVEGESLGLLKREGNPAFEFE